ncbi:hypothetical protein LJ739_00095 [Aestuariibacter halophilus]|uniref:DUF2441 domain-containing protein n=1 Tax=Fluctibacter halophilus TaxID=226011 RepID=A0ABS8G235_9ALTE|nr:hypothetical protein [Aestuariibacter halophilus]MCC2614637.1 hypothetical protein [Aestuariibacter halophilus]
MKLKEFDLWAYKLELDDSRAFTLESRCVCAHFERHFKGLETESVYRVVVKLSEGDPRDGTLETSSSVLKYYQSFDFDSFRKLNPIEKKELLLSKLYNSLLSLCEANGWAKEPFEKARSSVIEERFLNSYEVSRKNNPNRSMVASLNAEHTAEAFRLDIIVTDKSGKEIYKNTVLSEEPDEFFFNGRIGRIRWESSNVLNYIAKDKSILETIRFDEQA